MSRDRLLDWERTTAHMAKLIESEMPDGVKAHYVVRVLLPRLAVLCGTTHFTKELAAMLADGLSLQTGRCRYCHAAESIGGEEHHDVCAACLAKFDQFAAEVEADE